jgi:hypothetical protein
MVFPVQDEYQGRKTLPPTNPSRYNEPDDTAFTDARGVGSAFPYPALLVRSVLRRCPWPPDALGVEAFCALSPYPLPAPRAITPRGPVAAINRAHDASSPGCTWMAALAVARPHPPTRSRRCGGRWSWSITVGPPTCGRREVTIPAM